MSAKNFTLTRERLVELMEYDPMTGIFIRVKDVTTGAPPRVTAWAGDIVGTMRPDGYLVARIDDVLHRLHRLAWLYMTGEHPRGNIDHIDGNPGNNRWSNLRDVDQSINLQNLRAAPSHNKSSGLLGVTWHKGAGKWMAHIKLNGKQKYLGLFEDPSEAHLAYLNAKREIHHGCMI